MVAKNRYAEPPSASSSKSLVDEQTMAVSSSVLDVLARVTEKLRDRIKPELMQSYLEVNTDVPNDRPSQGRRIGGAHAHH